MSIVTIDGETVTHCCTACGVEREVALELIELGVVPDAAGHFDLRGNDRADPLVVLPACTRCGSIEQLRLPSGTGAGGDVDVAALWERLGGEPLERDANPGEPSTDDLEIPTDDYRSSY
jgi:hypothetical protein